MAQFMPLLYGLIGKIVLMFAAMLLCVLGARLGEARLIKANPQWSKQQRAMVRPATVMVALVVFAAFLIWLNRP